VKIKRDRSKAGRRYTGGFGVMWYRGNANWRVNIHLVPGVSLEVAWPRKAKPLPKLEEKPW
jgi:hypothetical protein